jgi:spermidine synthase
MDTDPDQWLRDSINKSFVQLHRLEEVLYTGQTKYQSVRIVRSGSLGLCLVLDGKIQSSQADEFIYHEALVHPAMITHPNPASVFVAGGGEGATLREVLLHPTVKRAVMVDIDDEVVALSKKYLPGHARGAFEDRRTELYHVDAREYLEGSKEKFDIIIIDLPDPIEAGPACRLFTRQFYDIVYNRLADDGLISVQAGSASLIGLLNLTAVNNTLNSVFPIVSVCKVDMPCFGGPWGFCFASKKYDPRQITIKEIDERISQRSLSSLRFYDGLTHQGIFSLPRYIRKALAGQRRIITDEDPLYLNNTGDHPYSG